MMRWLFRSPETWSFLLTLFCVVGASLSYLSFHDELIRIDLTSLDPFALDEITVTSANLSSFTEQTTTVPKAPGGSTRQPLIGMTYFVHFGDWDSTNEQGQTGFCHQSGWNKTTRRPAFKPDLHPQGYCYSSQQFETAEIHGETLAKLHVDFLMVPLESASLLRLPYEDREFLGFKALIQGLKLASNSKSLPRIRVVPVLPITCRGAHCPDGRDLPHEQFVWNSTLQLHLNEIARLFSEDPNAFLKWHSKPLIAFNIGSGLGVKSPDGEPAFQGAGHYIPTPDEFNPMISLSAQKQILLRDLFTVRFVVQSQKEEDFTRISLEIWPRAVSHHQTQFSEVQWASQFFPGDQPEASTRYLQKSLREVSGHPIALIHTWNEFAESEASGPRISLEPTWNEMTERRPAGHEAPDDGLSPTLELLKAEISALTGI